MCRAVHALGQLPEPFPGYGKADLQLHLIANQHPCISQAVGEKGQGPRSRLAGPDATEPRRQRILSTQRQRLASRDDAPRVAARLRQRSWGGRGEPVPV